MSMKMEELLQLIDAVSESDLTELEYKDENAEISLKKKLQPIQSGQQIEEVSCTEEIVQQKAALNKNEADGPEQKKGKIVTAPLVGTFYAAPAEDEEPFVKVGERVEKGQIVAIIEAMKLMNEICRNSDRSFCREWSVCRIWTATFCGWITGKVRTERCTV